MPTICRFALATGMRLGEICRLQVDDIDRAARTVVIRDRKDPRAKAGNHQTVPLLPKAWEIVAPLIEGREAGSVFRTSAASVSTAFTRACTALEIEDLHFHDLRHRATAQLFAMGLDIPRVALMTGHKTWAMLRRYTDDQAGGRAQHCHASETEQEDRAGRFPVIGRSSPPMTLHHWIDERVPDLEEIPFPDGFDVAAFAGWLGVALGEYRSTLAFRAALPSISVELAHVRRTRRLLQEAPEALRNMLPRTTSHL